MYHGKLRPEIQKKRYFCVSVDEDDSTRPLFTGRWRRRIMTIIYGRWGMKPWRSRQFVRWIKWTTPRQAFHLQRWPLITGRVRRTVSFERIFEYPGSLFLMRRPCSQVDSNMKKWLINQFFATNLLFQRLLLLLLLTCRWRGRWPLPNKLPTTISIDCRHAVC